MFQRNWIYEYFFYNFFLGSVKVFVPVVVLYKCVLYCNLIAVLKHQCSCYKTVFMQVDQSGILLYYISFIIIKCWLQCRVIAVQKVLRTWCIGPFFYPVMNLMVLVSKEGTSATFRQVTFLKAHCWFKHCVKLVGKQVR